MIIRLAAGQFILKRVAMRFALHPIALRLATSDSNSAIDEQLPVDGLGPLFIGLVDWGWRCQVIGYSSVFVVFSIAACDLS